MGRAPCCEKDSVKRGPWTPEEDAKLLACVAQHGTGSWRTVPKKAGLQRCGKSCRLRWTNYLRPDLKHGRFTDQEEQTIVKLHAALGSRWSLIAAQLPGRTDNDVKNYWNTRLKKKLCEMGIDPITHKPISQLLADLAGSMANAAAASSSTSASPSPAAGRVVGTGTSMDMIADAALGCFKDDMLNVIMRRRPLESACPPQSVPRVPPPPPYLRHQLAPDGLPHCLRFLTSSPSPASTTSACSSTSTLTGGHSPAFMHLPHDQQPPQHTSRSMVDMALLDSTSSLIPGFLPPFTQGYNHQKPNDPSFNQLKSLPPTVNTSDYTMSALAVAQQSALSMNHMAVTNQEIIEQPWLITEEEQDFQEQHTIMWPAGAPQDHHQHQAPSSAVNVRINSTAPCATNITSKVEMQPWSPGCTSRSSSTCSNLPGVDHHHATTAASTSQLADHTTQLSPADAMLWDLSDLLP